MRRDRRKDRQEAKQSAKDLDSDCGSVTSRMSDLENFVSHISHLNDKLTINEVPF